MKTAPCLIKDVFARPKACSLHMAVAMRSTDRSGHIGWDPDGNRIYYEDGAIAGHYSLTVPLARMSADDLQQAFPKNRRFVFPRKVFVELWTAARGGMLGGVN